MEKILKARDGYRAILKHDEFRVMPDGDCYIPSFLIWGGNYYSFELGGVLNEHYMPDTAANLFKVWERLNDNRRHGQDTNRLFERWMRIVYGVPWIKVKSVHGYSQGDWGCEVQIATDKWLEATGARVEGLDKEAEENSDLLSWALGDCWEIVVQKGVQYAQLDDDGEVIEGTEWSAWKDTDTTCVGFYGDTDQDYFVEEGDRMIDEAKAEDDTPKLKALAERPSPFKTSTDS